MGKTRRLPKKEEPKRYATWAGSGLAHKYQTGLEKLAREKRSSLLASSPVTLNFFMTMTKENALV
jgi:hypothetical protein